MGAMEEGVVVDVGVAMRVGVVVDIRERIGLDVVDKRWWIRGSS